MPKPSFRTLYPYCLLLLLAFGFVNGCKNAQVAPAPGRDNALFLGNPSNAGTDPDNYLLEKPQYTLSYNCSRGTANWVSWHLGKAWKGTATRADDFRPDPALPAGCYRVVSGDYTNTGFDRGHLCPSDDRDASADDNSATFLMTNIIPQAPDLNRQTWRMLEEYCRQLVAEGNELYLIAGVYGKGGSNSSGLRNTLADGKVTVPARCWKIALVVPQGTDDAKRIGAATRVIAVDIPNRQSADNGNKNWDDYLVSVDAIEAATGYDFFSELPATLQQTLESKVDKGRQQ
ncbi:MAG: DNA/RNA non-specific endonuclease [Cytophagales bacterium]|nr:DNA/RNA non-specific endonuclease [Cytophagales bacterium]